MILSYAIVCGLSWISAGVLSFIASNSLTKNAAQLPFVLYTVSFIIFLGLSGPVILRINEHNNEFKDNIYANYLKQARRSGDEFINCATWSLITILPCIVITYLAVFFLEAGPVFKTSHTYKDIDTQVRPSAPL